MSAKKKKKSFVQAIIFDSHVPGGWMSLALRGTPQIPGMLAQGNGRTEGYMYKEPRKIRAQHCLALCALTLMPQ